MDYGAIYAVCVVRQGELQSLVVETGYLLRLS